MASISCVPLTDATVPLSLSNQMPHVPLPVTLAATLQLPASVQRNGIRFRDDDMDVVPTPFEKEQLNFVALVNIPSQTLVNVPVDET